MNTRNVDVRSWSDASEIYSVAVQNNNNYQQIVKQTSSSSSLSSLSSDPQQLQQLRRQGHTITSRKTVTTRSQLVYTIVYKISHKWRRRNIYHQLIIYTGSHLRAPIDSIVHRNYARITTTFNRDQV